MGLLSRFDNRYDLMIEDLWTLSYLTADFCKLVLYLTFFSVLCMFYGMPIHIIRDVAITVRSFYKRISDFIRYRQATKDMNTRYPDATADEVHREDVCIICREVMHASQRLHEASDPQSSQSHPGANDHERNRYNNTNDAALAGDERFRPKKLPCGHILHCTCLRSWLERQQNCPTCRAPVLVSNPTAPRSRSDNITRDMRAQENRPEVNDPIRGGAPRRNTGQNTVNFGPFRLSFGVRQGFVRDVNNVNRANLRIPTQSSIEIQQRLNSLERLRQASNTNEQAAANISSFSPQDQLLQIEQRLMGEIRSLGAHAAQLFLVRTLEAELARLRMEINYENLASVERPILFQPFAMDPMQRPQLLTSTQVSTSSREQQNHAAGHQGLPNGLILPHGWNTVLLRRVEVDGETANAISSLSIFNNVASEDAVIHPILQPTVPSLPSVDNFQTIEQQEESSQETGISAEQSRADPLALGSLADMSHSLPDKLDADIQLVRRWDEAEVAKKCIGQNHTNSTTGGISDYWHDTAPTPTSTDSISAIGSQHDPSLQMRYSDQPVKLGSEEGFDRLESDYVNVGGRSENTAQTISRNQLKGKGRVVTVEDFDEDENLSPT